MAETIEVKVIDINNVNNDPGPFTGTVSNLSPPSLGLGSDDQTLSDIDICNNPPESDKTREGRRTPTIAKLFSMKIFQSWVTETVTKCRPIIDPIVKALPVIMASIGIILMGTDQSTDGISSYGICNVQCKCTWYQNQCIVPYRSDGKDHPCYEVFRNNTNSNEYCDTEGGGSETACNKLIWSPNTPRHPVFCSASIATILVPSIINSTYLLARIWLLYPTILKYLELTEGLIIRLLKITLLVLYILQLLPYVWLTMILCISIKIWRSGTNNESDDKEFLMKENRKIKLVFCILEDIPQMIIHAMLIIYSGPGSYLGLASSALSITLTLMLFKRPTSSKTTAIQLFTTFIAVGTRALVCASYASVIVDYIVYHQLLVMLLQLKTLILQMIVLIHPLAIILKLGT